MGAVLTAAGAGGVPAHHRAGAAGHLRGVLPLRLLRRLPADLAGRSATPASTSARSSTASTTTSPASTASRSTSCATYIVLFTIYGAVLDATGAGRFFVDLSFAAFRRSRSAPGRTVTLSGFLLGTVSGSGHRDRGQPRLGRLADPAAGPATRASRPAACWPRPGIGAILSPPTLGAAAFIIAEYLGVPYLQVLLLGDRSRRCSTTSASCWPSRSTPAGSAPGRSTVTTRPARALLLRFGYHFLSLVRDRRLPRAGHRRRSGRSSTRRSWRPLFGLVERAVSRRDPLDPDAVRRLAARARCATTPSSSTRRSPSGIRSVLPVAAVCAAAGIITSVIAKTGLGQSLADLLVAAARGAGHRPDRGADPDRGVRGRRDRGARPGRAGHRVVHHLAG